MTDGVASKHEHDEVDHEAKAPTCTEIGGDAYVTCSRCDHTTHKEKSVLGHSFVDNRCERCGIEASQGLGFTLNDDGKSYSVTGIGFCTDTEIVIPPEYEGKPVTSIGDEAFAACPDLTSINFTGTKAQWNAISKDISWNSYTGSYTDGDISKSNS